MKIDNGDWGAFIVTKKILQGVPVAYCLRTEPFREMNGWQLVSIEDSEEDQDNPDCYTIAAMTTLLKANPALEVMMEIFNAPWYIYLGWIYEGEELDSPPGPVDFRHLKGFYDYGRKKMTTIPEILAGPGLPADLEV